METNDESNPPTANASSMNIAVQELDEETARKLRGDAIGDTTYSETFVLKTLQHYADLKWNSEVENDLCSLWDMTEEQAVCQLLFKVAYPKLATCAIDLHNEPRFIEIVVGIFANLLCSKCEKSITNEEVKTVLNLLNSNDPYILIQVMRFLHALSYMFDKLDFVEEVHLNRFDFILCNSTNKELLSQTLKTLASITEDTSVNGDFLSGELLVSAVTGYRVLTGESDCFESQEQQQNVKHLINFVCNLCSYIEMDVRIVSGLISNFYKFISEVKVLFEYYSSEDNLLPMTDELRFYMEGFTYICRVLNVVYDTTIAKTLYKIFCTVYERDLSNLDAVAELFCYFVSVGTFKELKRDFKSFCRLERKEIFSYIMKQNYEFNFDYESNVRRILAEFEC